MKLALPALIAALCCWVGLIWLRQPGRLPSDRPNHRSLHLRAKPRGGGTAIWLGWLAACAIALPSQAWLPPLMMLIVVSLWDDWKSLPAAPRLLVHVAAGALWIALAAQSVNVAIALIAIVWMANLFNFMDGSDGMAAAMALFGFGAYAVAGAASGSAGVTATVALVAAIVPFFFFNFPPARVILGDVGAVPLGFLAAVFGIEGWQSGAWPAWFPVLVFYPFIADATVTLARRLLCRRRVWEAHNEHYYQKLVRMGFGHAGTLALYAALMAGTSLSALAAVLRAPGAGPGLLFFWSGILASIYVMIDYSWHRQGSRFDESKG